MADPLLTALCSICHLSAPRYKCPGCGVATCSAPCSKKHKAWSDCRGERDPTAYLAPDQLRTVSGVNNDYNFLHKVGLSVERAERILVGDRALVREEELRPPTVQQVKWQTGRDGIKRRLVLTRTLPDRGGRKLERLLAHRLAQLNIQLLCAPTGMTRQKLNKTTFNRRSGGINWQVEWLVVVAASEPEPGQSHLSPVRLLSKVLEGVPLYQAYDSLLLQNALPGGGQGRPRRPLRAVRPGLVQNAFNSAWRPGTDAAQDPLTGSWLLYQGADIGQDWPGESDRAQRESFRFFLGGPPAGPRMPIRVTAVDAAACLREMLANTRVLEFPSIWVLEAGQPLPADFVLVPKELEPPRLEPGQGQKRRPGLGAGHSLEPERANSTKRARISDGAEGGDLNTVAAAIPERASGEDNDNDNDDDDDDDDGDSTSSSGSDSESG